ncbi:GroES-like protein [Neoconidiobolus thromboides FSU 785]|nr:GroES-like protein [Neoconidiobolus thromboides FSU 785]
MSLKKPKSESPPPMGSLLLKLVLKKPTYCLVVIAAFLSLLKGYFFMVNYKPPDRGLVYSKLKMQSIQIKESGSNSIIYIGSTPKPIPRNFEVLVKVKAFGINRLDLLQREGKFRQSNIGSNIMGIEVAGTVTEVGEDVKNIKIGDRVCGLVYGGGYSEYAVIHSKLTFKLPNSLSFEQGAAIPESYLSSYYILKKIGQIAPGKNILINGVGDGMEDSIIQLSKYYKSNKIIIVCNSYDKIKHYEKMGASKGINYEKESNLLDKIQKSGIKGIDLIVDNLGTNLFYENLKTLSKNGIYVLLNSNLSEDIQLDLNYLLKNSLSLISFQLFNNESDKLFLLAEEFKKEILPNLDNKLIKIHIDKAFNWIEMEDAHQYLSSNSNLGKVIGVID